MNSVETDLVQDLCHKADILEHYLTRFSEDAIKEDHREAIKLRMHQLTIARMTVQYLIAPSPRKDPQ